MKLRALVLIFLLNFLGSTAKGSWHEVPDYINPAYTGLYNWALIFTPTGHRISSIPWTPPQSPTPETVEASVASPPTSDRAITPTPTHSPPDEEGAPSISFSASPKSERRTNWTNELSILACTELEKLASNPDENSSMSEVYTKIFEVINEREDGFTRLSVERHILNLHKYSTVSPSIKNRVSNALKVIKKGLTGKRASHLKWTEDAYNFLCTTLEEELEQLTGSSRIFTTILYKTCAEKISLRFGCHITTNAVRSKILFLLGKEETDPKYQPYISRLSTIIERINPRTNKRKRKTSDDDEGAYFPPAKSARYDLEDSPSL